jgi:hypothetical protein
MTAEENFRAAFERLKSNTPKICPLGTLVSQNNVAKEAGTDPSALKKSRFPTLIAEIQQYVSAIEVPTSNRQKELVKKKKSRDLKERFEDVTKQRDLLASMLAEADLTILELKDKLKQYEDSKTESNIISIERKK